MHLNTSSVCIAILNWNGIKHLQYLLPTVLDAVSHYNQPCPIIVLDNQSTEGDLCWLNINYPQIETIIAPANDYLFSYNWLLNLRKEDIVILLNNDLRVDKNFIAPLLNHFSDPCTFAVSAKSYDWEGTVITSGPSLFRQQRGWCYFSFDTSMQHTSYTLFASGGFMAVNRQKFLELGGFDRLFYPAYGEDLDLSYRAWCKGWKSIYEPASIVYHREGGSWDAGSTQRSARLILRAHFLFHWRNLRQPVFRLKRNLYLPWLIFRKLLGKDTTWLEVYNDARELWKERRTEALKNIPRINVSVLKNTCGTEVIQIDNQ